jgi:osmoprotectant transport system ATP-binding protein
VIVFDHVSKTYEDGTVAVDDLSFTCATGEITVLVGSSGCGKTTSLRMINRLIEATSGIITIDGRNVRSSDPAELRRSIGYVIQQGGLFPHRTIADNIATVPRLMGTRRRAARQQAVELMALVGLPASMADRYPYQLSGGQQQRVGVARALAADPPVLLLDEPFSAVDPVVRGDLQQELLGLQSQLHKTVVFVTHDIDEAIRVGDHIAVMRTGGKLVQFDTPERVLASPSDGFVEGFLGDDRGIRWLSFFPSGTLCLRPPVTASTTSSPADVKEAASGSGDTWVLLVDDGRRPVGWVEVTTLDGSTAAVDRRVLRPVGRAFTPGRDSVRAALDALVLSPAGFAVAVDVDGALLGVTGYDDLMTAIRNSQGRP